MKKTQGIDEFIKSNYISLTVCEMAKELGVSDACLSLNCKRLGITPISGKEKTIQFIKDHPLWRPEKIAETLGFTPQGIRNLISREGLRPKKESLSPESLKNKMYIIKGSAVATVKESPPPQKVISAEEEKITLAQYDKKVAAIRADRKNFTSYNQTRSPYGFADELNGIQATKEPQSFYMENVRL